MVYGIKSSESNLTLQSHKKKWSTVWGEKKKEKKSNSLNEVTPYLIITANKRSLPTQGTRKTQRITTAMTPSNAKHLSNWRSFSFLFFKREQVYGRAPWRHYGNRENKETEKSSSKKVKTRTKRNSEKREARCANVVLELPVGNLVLYSLLFFCLLFFCFLCLLSVFYGGSRPFSGEIARVQA